jgi:hypothetical protein
VGLDLADDGEEGGFGGVGGVADDVIVGVALADLGQALGHGDRVAVGAGGLVAVAELVVRQGVVPGELRRQDDGQAAQ